MFPMKENPRYNIVSVRINDEEREFLDRVSRKTRKTISEIIREAMQLAAPELAGVHDRVEYGHHRQAARK